MRSEKKGEAKEAFCSLLSALLSRSSGAVCKSRSVLKSRGALEQREEKVREVAGTRVVMLLTQAALRENISPGFCVMIHDS